MDRHKVHFTVSLLIKNEGMNIQLTTRAANMELRERVPKPSLALILDWRLAVPWNAVNWIIKAQLMAVTFFKIRHFSFVDILNLPCCEASSSVSSLGGLWGTPSPPSPCLEEESQFHFHLVLQLHLPWNRHFRRRQLLIRWRLRRRFFFRGHRCWWRCCRVPRSFPGRGSHPPRSEIQHKLSHLATAQKITSKTVKWVNKKTNWKQKTLNAITNLKIFQN